MESIPLATNPQIGTKEPNDSMELNMVKELLDWCYDNTCINRLKRKGTRDNLLHWASEKGMLQIVEYLVKENRISVNSLGYFDQTPLHEASEYGRSEIVNFLISSGANVTAKNVSGEIPLQVLVKNFHVESKHQQNFAEVAKLLIENGSDVNCKNSNGETPLFILVNEHSSSFISTKEKDAEICIEVAKTLIEKGAHLNTKNNQGSSILHFLAERVNYISDQKKSYEEEIAKLLIEKGENINITDGNLKTPLHVALNSNRKDSHKYAKFLISNGANLNAIDSSGESPFELAIQKGNYEIAELLLAKGVHASNQNNLSDKGYLHKAASKGHIKICQLLISLGAKIDLEDTEGNTPLLNAVKNIGPNSGHFDIVKMLLEKGASPNIANNEKNVPLHYAKSKELAELLLEKGAITNFKNIKDQTPKDLAFQNKLKEVVESLVQHETRAADRGLNNCMICFRPKNGTFAFLPCGHAKTCENCCKNIIHLHPPESNPECPICRQPVTIYQKIFI